jgi:hypothetical protein
MLVATTESQSLRMQKTIHRMLVSKVEGIALLASEIETVAYSTFSTYEWETLSTMRSGAFALAALYAVGSLVFGLAATWCGAAIAEML